MDAGLLLLLQRIFDALTNSAIYASLALALVIIYRSTGLLNFAQGEMATFSAYVAFVLLVGAAPGLTGGSLAAAIGAPYPTVAAIGAAVVFGAIAGGVTERLVIRPLRETSELAVVSITIGLFLGVNSLVEQWWGTAPRQFPSLFPDAASDYLDVAGARLRYSAIGAWATLLVLLAALAWLLQRTRGGLAFRAVSFNRESAELSGIRSARTLMWGWVLASALGAVAAALSASSVLLEPKMMLRVLVYAFAAATLGGLDSPRGAIIGGVVIGLSQTLVPAYIPFIGFELSVLPALVVMVIVLVVRPAGLFGTQRLERV